MARSIHFAKTACLTFALCLACALPLQGCASGNSHQIIDAGEDCTSCHSDAKQTYEVAQPKVAAAASSQMIVKTSAEKLVVCDAKFTSEDGSTYVPEQCSTVAVENGEATIAPGEGVWAVCIDEGSSSKSILVRIDATESEQSASVEL